MDNFSRRLFGDAGKIYDLFISYRAADADPEYRTIQGMATSMGLRVFDPDVDLKGKKVGIEEMQRHVGMSKVCLVLITSSYFESKFCRGELRGAIELLGERRIVPCFSNANMAHNQVKKMIKSPHAELGIPEEDIAPLDLRDRLFKGHQIECIHSPDAMETVEHLKRVMNMLIKEEGVQLSDKFMRVVGIDTQRAQPNLRPKSVPLGASSDLPPPPASHRRAPEEGRLPLSDLRQNELAELVRLVVFGGKDGPGIEDADDAHELKSQLTTPPRGKKPIVGANVSPTRAGKADTKKLVYTLKKNYNVGSDAAVYVAKATEPYRPGGKLETRGVPSFLTGADSLQDFMEAQGIKKSLWLEFAKKGSLDLLGRKVGPCKTVDDVKRMTAMLELAAVSESIFDDDELDLPDYASRAQGEPTLSQTQKLLIEDKVDGPSKKMFGNNFGIFCQLFAGDIFRNLLLLRVVDQAIGEAGVKALSGALKASAFGLPVLTDLNLSNNAIKGASEALSGIVERAPMLTTLRARNNNLTTPSLAAVVAAFQTTQAERKKQEDDNGNPVKLKPIGLDFVGNKMNCASVTMSKKDAADFAYNFGQLEISTLDLTDNGITTAMSGERHQDGHHVGMLYRALKTFGENAPAKGCRLTINVANQDLTAMSQGKGVGVSAYDDRSAYEAAVKEMQEKAYKLVNDMFTLTVDLMDKKCNVALDVRLDDFVVREPQAASGGCCMIL